MAVEAGSPARKDVGERPSVALGAPSHDLLVRQRRRLYGAIGGRVTNASLKPRARPRRRGRQGGIDQGRSVGPSAREAGQGSGSGAVPRRGAPCRAGRESDVGLVRAAAGASRVWHLRRVRRRKGPQGTPVGPDRLGADEARRRVALGSTRHRAGRRPRGESLKTWLARGLPVAGLLALTALLAVHPDPPRIPEQAPAFFLPDLQGRPVALESFRGHPLLVNFWGIWCLPCRAELPELERLAAECSGASRWS